MEDILTAKISTSGQIGPEGPQGPAGIGLPSGGSAGQILAKIDSTDYNTEWVNTSLTPYTAGEGLVLADHAFSIDEEVVAKVEDLEDKQDKLTAGTNITIEDNVISATGGGSTYTAGDNISIEDNVISAVDTKYTAGTNITINSGVISATSPTLTAGEGIEVDGLTISVDDTIATQEDIEDLSSVSASLTGSSTNQVKYITIDDQEYKIYSNGVTNYYSETEPESAVEGDLWTYQSQNEGSYIQDAAVNNNKLTITKSDDTVVNYEPTYSYEGTYDASTNPIATKSYVDGKISDVFTYKGSCVYADLPSSPSVGDVWNVTDAHGAYPAGTNYAWNGTAWDPLGGSIDLSNYATTQQLTSGLSAKQNVLTAGTGISISNNKITNTVNSSNFATRTELGSKVSNTGDYMSGILNFSETLNPGIAAMGSDGALILQGGKDGGARLRLNGYLCSTEVSEYGGFLINANNGEENASLIGFPNAKLFWNGEDVMTTEGGWSIKSPFILSNSNRYIATSSNDTNYLLLSGGTDTGSAYLGLCGKDRSGSDSGMFALHARNADGHYILRGQPDGTLTWGGSAVAAIPEQITLTTLHNQIQWTRANVYKCGRIVTVNISFRAKGTIAQSAYIFSGFPLPIDIAGDEGMEVIVIYGSGYRKAKLWDDGRMQMSTGSCSAGNVYTMNFSYISE